MPPFPQFERVSENALLVRLGDRLDSRINQYAHQLVAALQTAALPGVMEITPAYASVLLQFDPFGVDYASLLQALQVLLPNSEAAVSLAGTAGVVMIPVCYGGSFGPDLDEVARLTGLSSEAVIQRHTAGIYPVAMLGFAPGFPYLLGLEPGLHVPRRATPRTRVAAGSVAIGGAQTGIYPSELPGGWQLIGQPPLRLFDPARTPPCWVNVGQSVQFQAIDAATFNLLQEAAA
jgi:KipI family sensor histidine kinase inhibitor